MDPRAVSLFSASIIIAGVSSLFGYALIPDVDHSFYPWVLGISLTYLIAGQVYCTSNEHMPEPSRKLIYGKVDVVWGLKAFWWFAWWPRFWIGKK